MTTATTAGGEAAAILAYLKAQKAAVFSESVRGSSSATFKQKNVLEGREKALDKAIKDIESGAYLRGVK